LDDWNYIRFNLKESFMFSTPYSSIPEYQAHVDRAHRLRAAAVGSLFGDLGRWISNSFRIGWISAAAR
jgi:hypothetical protein